MTLTYTDTFYITAFDIDDAYEQAGADISEMDFELTDPDLRIVDMELVEPEDRDE